MTDKICMIGLGYVGLPLAIAFAEKYPVIGFDINRSRIDELEAGKDRTLEVDDELLASVKPNITYTFDIELIRSCNIYIVMFRRLLMLTNVRISRPLLKQVNQFDYHNLFDPKRMSKQSIT